MTSSIPIRSPRALARLAHLLALVSIAAALAGCAGEPTRRQPVRSAEEVRAQLATLLPSDLADRDGWAADIQTSFQHLGLLQSTENLCAVLAVTEQESGYKADPTVPGLGRIAREEIVRRAARLKVPELVVDAALKLDSPDGRTWGERIAALRTEREMSELFEAFVGQVPLGRRLFGGANPVRTGGPMQVAIDFAEEHADERGYPWPIEHSIRREVFTRRGGMYFGIAHLLDYPNSYERHLYRYADFNAGWYASRNAAFQAAVTAATGIALALDGDLVLHDVGLFDEQRISRTEVAVRTLGDELDLTDATIHRALERGDRFDFEETDVYRRVFALADRRTGRRLPRAVVPQIRLHSPKITRHLTTEWFATRVQTRYQRCINRAFGQ